MGCIESRIIFANNLENLVDKVNDYTNGRPSDYSVSNYVNDNTGKDHGFICLVQIYDNNDLCESNKEKIFLNETKLQMQPIEVLLPNEE